MAEFINLQVYGVPVVTYGLVGLTTAVLAYATFISDMGGKMPESLANITESPMASLSNMNPLASLSEISTESKSESESSFPAGLGNLTPFPSAEKEPGLEEPAKQEESSNPENQFAGLKGGKERRRRKTPKSKKRGGGKTKKSRLSKK